MLYRIFTENKHLAQDVIVRAMADHGFEGYTLLRGTGFWKGRPEKTIIVEISAPEKDISKVSLRIIKAAKAIKSGLQQECVLVQEIPCSQELV